MGQNVSTDELVEYDGRMIYREVAEYFRGEVAVQRAYDDAHRDVTRAWEDAQTAMYRAAEDEGRTFDRYDNADDRRKWTEARDRFREAEQAADTARRNASRDLLLNSPHREVKWIAENCLFAHQGGDIEGHARSILKILPATTEEIWTEAKERRDMCDVFDRFYDQAEAAGLFNGGEAPAGARELMALRNYIRRSYGSSYMREFMPHVDRVIKAVREDADRRLAEARAEWQGLDEAWRSERSRRGAATRAANRATEGANLGDVPQPVSMDHPQRVAMEQLHDAAAAITRATDKQDA